MFILLGGINLNAQDTLTVEQLDYKFVTIDEGRMSPVSSLASIDVAGTFINCQDERMIEFCGSRSFNVWVDGRLASEKDETFKCVYLNVSDLCFFSGRDTVFVSLVSDSGLYGVTARTVDILPLGGEHKLPIKRTPKGGFWQLGFVVCGVILILARLFLRKDFAKIPRLTDSQTDKFFTIGNMIQLTITCAVGAFLWTLMGTQNPLYVFSTFGILLFWWLMKTILTLISGALFRFRSQAIWQSNFLLQFWTIMFLLLYGFALIDTLFLKSILLSPESFVNLLCALEGLFIFGVFLIFRSDKGMKNLHRFIYLCTTEILPGVLIIHFFLE